MWDPRMLVSVGTCTCVYFTTLCITPFVSCARYGMQRMDAFSRFATLNGVLTLPELRWPLVGLFMQVVIVHVPMHRDSLFGHKNNHRWENCYESESNTHVLRIGVGTINSFLENKLHGWHICNDRLYFYASSFWLLAVHCNHMWPQLAPL